MLWSYAHVFRAALENLTLASKGLVGTVTEQQIAGIKGLLELLSNAALYVNLSSTRHLAEELLGNLSAKTSVETLQAKIASVHSMARKELSERKFFYVPNERVGFYRNRELCGALVTEKFPDAVPDILEAGNCYALERPTACVFHLMRVIPYGMAALAKMLNVPFSQSIWSMEWGRIIPPIEKAVDKLQQLPRTSQRFRDQKYYSEIVQHLYFCKDAWRNHVSHSRESYDMSQARSVMDHTKLVMELLSKRLKRPFKLR